jgi:hypothetical protein
MKILLNLVDHTSFPLNRVKRVKWTSYRCGLARLKAVAASLEIEHLLETRLFITGGKATEEHHRLFDIITDDIDNGLQDFGAYLCAARHVLETPALEPILPVFCNSSCPPAYLNRLLAYLRTLVASSGYSPQARHVIAPSAALLFRRSGFWHYLPHFQSYCFFLPRDVVSLFVEHVSSVNPVRLCAKKDFILELEVGFSRFLFERNHRTKILVDRDELVALSRPLKLLASSPCSIFDPRLEFRRKLN